LGIAALTPSYALILHARGSAPLKFFFYLSDGLSFIMVFAIWHRVGKPTVLISLDCGQRVPIPA
jgi:hypothetical protein